MGSGGSAVSEGMHCLNCGYVLDHLPESRCPECGRPFDPDDQQSFTTRYVSGRRQLLLALCGPGLIGAAILVLACCRSSAPIVRGVFFVAYLILIVAGWILGLVIFLKCGSVFLRRQYILRERSATLLALLLSGAVVVLPVIPIFASIIGCPLIRP